MKHLKVTQNQNVVTVALNRPEKRNAFHPEMIVEITKVFEAFGKDKNVRAVLLTGEGESFCAGGDLEWMRSMAKFTFRKNLTDANQLYDMFWRIRSCPVPVIGRVFGHCFGGGAGLVAVCDIVAAEQKTQFCFSEVKVGLVPAVISPFVTERAQPAWIREWFLTARVFLANEAVTGGLVNFEGNQLDVDDFVDASVFLMEHYDARQVINVGGGTEVSIKDLAVMVAQTAGFKGKIIFDRTKPDGAMRKLLDNTRMLERNWRPKVNLEEGVARTYAWYSANENMVGLQPAGSRI